MNLSRLLGMAASLVVVVMWAASCGPNDSCKTTDDCLDGKICVESKCVVKGPETGGDGPCTPGALCRPTDPNLHPCDAPEICDANGQCPPDTYVAAENHLLCRPPENACDLPEYCDGTSAECPADQYAEANTPCAEASCADGMTTPARYCEGGNKTCVAVAPISCNGYQCNGSTCGTSCTSDADCLSTHYCQPGNQCAPKRQDGQPCIGTAFGADCLSGTCTGSYLDSDGDGFGAGAVGYFCGAPEAAGRTALVGDCCDSDNRAKPGQTNFFTTQRACGGWDFDCNGTTLLQDVSSDACQTVGSCGTFDRECSESTGWAGSPPGCGVAGTYVTSCGSSPICNQSTCPGCNACNAVTATRTQACR